MRHIAIIICLIFLIACNTRPKQPDNSPIKAPEVSASTDSIVQFLLTAAALDFYNHRPPDPLRFRDVRLGHLTGSNGVRRYLLCGQFLSVEEKNKVEWISFVTIKTDPYEQWLGNQAYAYCNDTSVVWENVSDLSSLLQIKLDSLRR